MKQLTDAERQALLDQIAAQHEQWVKHPMTVLLIKILDKLAESNQNAALNACHDMSVSDEKIRLNVVSLKQTKTIKEIVYATAQFTNAANSTI